MVFDVSTYTGLQWFRRNSNILEYLEIDEEITTSTELNTWLNKLSIESFNKISSDNFSEDSWILSDGSILAILNKLNKQLRRISDIFDKIFQVSLQAKTTFISCMNVSLTTSM
jgi:hypothetical protein